jgi:hypothetical protein
MDLREQLLQQFIVRPGEAAGLAARDPGWTGGTEFPELAADERQQRAIDSRRLGSAELSEAQELLWASDRYALLVVQPAGRAGGLVQEAVVGGARPRLPVADLARAARARAHRHLQPLALRGGRRAEGAPRVARAAAAPAGRAERGVLADPLRGHQRLRAPPRPQRHEGREVLPPRLPRGAEGALPRAAGSARQGVEVQRRRRRRATPFRRVPRRVRGRADGDLDPVGAVVRGPGRSLVDHAGDRRAGPRSRPKRTPRTWRRARSSRPSARA